MAKISATMALVLAEMSERGGELVCWRGGFWTYPNCTVKGTVPSFNGEPCRVPEWYAGTNTITALLKRGEIVVAERAASGYPIRVRLNAQNADALAS